MKPSERLSDEVADKRGGIAVVEVAEMDRIRGAWNVADVREGGVDVEWRRRLQPVGFVREEVDDFTLDAPEGGVGAVGIRWNAGLPRRGLERGVRCTLPLRGRLVKRGSRGAAAPPATSPTGAIASGRRRGEGRAVQQKPARAGGDRNPWESSSVWVRGRRGQGWRAEWWGRSRQKAERKERTVREVMSASGGNVMRRGLREEGMGGGGGSVRRRLNAGDKMWRDARTKWSGAKGDIEDILVHKVGCVLGEKGLQRRRTGDRKST